jgi:adenylate cyclase class 2
MEVEIKLLCPNLAVLRKKLQKAGAVLISSKHQIDTYYDHPAKVLVKSGEYLRIRKTADKKTLAHHLNLADGVNDECEISLAADTPIEKILQRLGFPRLGTINKLREEYQLAGLKICLDQVKGIGNFIEIEGQARRGSQARVQKRLWRLAQKLGLSTKDKFAYWLCDIAVGKVKWPLKKKVKK